MNTHVSNLKTVAVMLLCAASGVESRSEVDSKASNSGRSDKDFLIVDMDTTGIECDAAMCTCFRSWHFGIGNCRDVAKLAVGSGDINGVQDEQACADACIAIGDESTRGKVNGFNFNSNGGVCSCLYGSRLTAKEKAEFDSFPSDFKGAPVEKCYEMIGWASSISINDDYIDNNFVTSTKSSNEKKKQLRGDV